MPHARGLAHSLAAGVVLLAALSLLAGCRDAGSEPARAPDGPVDLSAPEVGACRLLTPPDVARPADPTTPVPCSERHTAQTFAVGGLPDRFDDADYEDADLGAWAYRTCSRGFTGFLGADESLVLRTVLSWAWFRPSPQAWSEGARWYRCDVLGGSDRATGAGTDEAGALIDLPTDATGLLLGLPDDRWLVCADGASVAGSVKVPCAQPHDWRAVTTIKLGEEGDAYPGDRLSEVRTRDFCNDSVGAWLGYPPRYDFGYTWFHEGEWEAGNRRSVCWARTDA